MNALHLQFENLAYEGLKLFSDILYDLARISKVHPVIANMIGFLFLVLGFGITYLFLDFIEKEYLPKFKALFEARIKNPMELFISNAKLRLNKIGKKYQKKARKMVKNSIYLAIFAIPLFLMGTTLRGGAK